MNEIKVTLEGVGLSFTKEATLQQAARIISFLGHDSRVESSSEVSLDIPALIPKNQILPKDIIIGSKAKTYPQKITALAKYFKEHLNQYSFSPEEIRLQFKKMGDVPKNFTRDFSNTLDPLQYITCVDSESEQYELTYAGEEAVDNKFSEGIIKRSSVSKKTSTSKKIREEVEKLGILGDELNGYISYHDLPTKADKILWILEYTFTKNINILTPTEVEYLSGKLRDRIESGGFTALNSRNIRKSFVIQESKGYQIQKKGSDYLKSIQKTRE
jgi:hypothetical protein